MMKFLFKEFQPRLLLSIPFLVPLSLGWHFNVVRLRSLDMLVPVPPSRPVYYSLRLIWYLSCIVPYYTNKVSCRPAETQLAVSG